MCTVTVQVVSYLNEWHGNMSIALEPVIYSGPTGTNGVFNPACFIHTAFSYDLPTIKGISYITVRV